MMLLPLMKMIACSAILYGYYVLFLRNKKFHHYNRFYLLFSTVISIMIPFVKIPVLVNRESTAGLLVNKSIDLISVSGWEEDLAGGLRSTTDLFTYQNISGVLYLMVTTILMFILLRSLMYLRKLSNRYPVEYIDSLKFYNTTEPGTPFSFFRSIFWNINVDLNSKAGQQIFRHELFHVQQKHSADILFLQLATVVFWINPIFHLIKKEIKAIHEFLADQHAVDDANLFDYAELLVVQSMHAKTNPVTNYFFQNHIKRRIAMITQIKNKKYNYWTRLMVLPLSIVLFCAIALYAQRPGGTIQQVNYLTGSQTLEEQVTVVVDAGHGGKDAGARLANGILEKDLTLAIARQIKKKAAAYGVNVIMTREEDIYPELKDRTELAKSVKASMIVSIHVATAPEGTPGNGFDIYVTNRNQQTIEESKLLGQNIAAQLKSVYETGPIKQNKQKIWILDAATCPAVLIECGYLTNEKDLAFISSAENQELIATRILQGIVEYQSAEKGTRFTDTVPATKRVKDSLQARINQAETEREKARRQVLEAKIAELENQQEQLIRKQQEVELAKQKLKEHRLAELQAEQELLNRRHNEVQVDQRTIKENRIVELKNQQDLLIQKQHEAEAEQRKVKEERIAELKRDQDILTQKQRDLEISRNEFSRKKQEIENDKQLQIKKQKEINAQQQAMVNTKRQEMQLNKQNIIQKQQELENERNRMTEQKRRAIENEKLLQLKRQREIQLKERQMEQERSADTPIKGEVERIFTKAEISPDYPGGTEAWQKYLHANLRYPGEAKKNSISGDVTVQFIVDRDGQALEVKAVSGPDELRSEAERVVRESGKWLPARQNGHIVKAYMKKTIRFDLQR